MKSKLQLTILFSLFVIITNSQSLTPSVIGASGAYITSTSCSMTWTVGEVMTDTYSSASNFFTQGFNQPDSDFVTAIVSLSPEENILIYPNPVIDYFIIDLKHAPGNHTICLYNIWGQMLLQENIPKGYLQIKIPIQEFANGLYLLNIINSESNLSSSFKINKVQ
jgi:hypothetical protein